MRESSPKGRSVRPRPFLFSPLFTGVRGETVWKIAEGVTSAILWRQEATDRDSLDSSRPLSEPRFGTHSDFPNSFGIGILRSSAIIQNQAVGKGPAQVRPFLPLTLQRVFLSAFGYIEPLQRKSANSR